MTPTQHQEASCISKIHERHAAGTHQGATCSWHPHTKGATCRHPHTKGRPAAGTRTPKGRPAAGTHQRANSGGRDSGDEQTATSAGCAAVRELQRVAKHGRAGGRFGRHSSRGEIRRPWYMQAAATERIYAGTRAAAAMGNAKTRRGGWEHTGLENSGGAREDGSWCSPADEAPDRSPSDGGKRRKK
jgi:hypothetical protein